MKIKVSIALQMTLTELTSNLSKVGDKIRNSGLHDNMFISMIHLILFSDGSGQILGTWKRNLEKPTKEQQLFAEIFTDESDDSEVFKFEKIEELEFWITQKLKETT